MSMTIPMENTGRVIRPSEGGLRRRRPFIQEVEVAPPPLPKTTTGEDDLRSPSTSGGSSWGGFTPSSSPSSSRGLSFWEKTKIIASALVPRPMIRATTDALMRKEARINRLAHVAPVTNLGRATQRTMAAVALAIGTGLAFFNSALGGAVANLISGVSYLTDTTERDGTFHKFLHKAEDALKSRQAEGNSPEELKKLLAKPTWRAIKASAGGQLASAIISSVGGSILLGLTLGGVLGGPIGLAVGGGIAVVAAIARAVGGGICQVRGAQEGAYFVECLKGSPQHDHNISRRRRKQLRELAEKVLKEGVEKGILTPS